MAVGEELWVGLGNGQVLIFDIIKNNSFEDEAYLVLGENKEVQKAEERKDKSFPIVNSIACQETTPNSQESGTNDGDTHEQNSENRNTAETVTSEHHDDDNITTEACEVDESSAASLNAVQEVVCVKGAIDGEQRSTEEQNISDNVYYSGYRFGLRLRVHYRINEEAVRCILLVREEEPLVLSCGGSFSEEGALSLWQRQSGEEGTNEWMPFSIKHRGLIG
ncbi:PREDICTED: uncharacterized protein LOC107335514 [Acropora digitifera]|uniref:uncharacterized protein LOC107335514 n=1 Tax=Acropora digitifera TaxID=70779 RepID=UPI00077B162E|nr:PREDICTED: uncharacterized protein LOC107335514 [Acropora digitifera]